MVAAGTIRVRVRTDDHDSVFASETWAAPARRNRSTTSTSVCVRIPANPRTAKTASGLSATSAANADASSIEVAVPLDQDGPALVDDLHNE